MLLICIVKPDIVKALHSGSQLLKFDFFDKENVKLQQKAFNFVLLPKV